MNGGSKTEEQRSVRKPLRQFNRDFTNPPSRPNSFDVDLDALMHNVLEVRRIVGPDVSIFAALKANAYGFGVLAVADALLAAGVDGLAVVDLRDAVSLREHGVSVPIHLYGGMLTTPELVSYVNEYQFMPTILDIADAHIYSRNAVAPIRIFVKAEVGLERFGVAAEDVPAFVSAVGSLPNLELHGLCTHLHVPRRDESEVAPYLDWQFERFTNAIRDVESSGVQIPIKMAASSGSLSLTTKMNLNAVDPGHLLFGLRPGGPENQHLNLRPVFLGLRSKLTQTRNVRRIGFPELAPFPVRDGMRVGVIPIGVADGMNLLHCGSVLLGGQRRPVLDVSLEHTRIDITGTNAQAGDEVVIIGRQGDEGIEIAEVTAHQRFRIPASLPLAIHQSVPRVYFKSGSDPQIPDFTDEGSKR